MCVCGSEVETTEHFLLRYYLFSPQRFELFENLKKFDSSFLNLKVKEKVSFLLYGSQSVTSKSSNNEILKFLIKYTKETARFDTSLFCPNQWFLMGFFWICAYRCLPLVIDNYNSFFYTMWLSLDTFQILMSCAAFIVSECLYWMFLLMYLF